MKLLIAPHNDDETLFCAYRVMREKPLVILVTHSTLQGDNGYDRAMESYKAMKILGASVCFLQIDEDKLTPQSLRDKLVPFKTNDLVYIPKIEGGNPQHDLISAVCQTIFSNTKEYPCYGKGETRSSYTEVIPTEEEEDLKRRAMDCYETQIVNPVVAHYFSTTKEYE